MTQKRNEQVNPVEERADPNKSNTAKVILGKSLPRSGHHFLVNLLECTLENDFTYCPFFANENCCRSQPCQNSYPGLLFLQKSHDLKLTDEISSSCKYLVQYRHPLPRLFSDWDLFVRKTSRLDNSKGFRRFAENRKEYYITFMKKWVLSNTEEKNFFMMSYESLVGEPIKTIQNFIRFATDKQDYIIDRSVLTASGCYVRERNNFQSHQHYDQSFVEEYQASIINEIPTLPYLPFKV